MKDLVRKLHNRITDKGIAESHLEICDREKIQLAKMDCIQSMNFGYDNEIPFIEINRNPKTSSSIYCNTFILQKGFAISHFHEVSEIVNSVYIK